MKLERLSSLLILLLLVPSSIVIAYPASGAVSKPSVTEFFVAYIDHSYDIPPVYGKDAYTGETIIKVGGRHVDNRTVDLTIQNQPFTPYLDSNNNTIGLYYSIRSKGHFEDWSDSSVHTTNGVQASTATVSTLVSIDIGYWGVQQGGQIDFQVAAVSGYPASDAAYCGQIHFNVVDQSDWSSIQTITIGNLIITTPTQEPYIWPTPTAIPYATATSLPQKTPIATPTQPNILTNILFGSNWAQTVLIGMAVVIAVLGFASVVIMWCKRNTK